MRRFMKKQFITYICIFLLAEYGLPPAVCAQNIDRLMERDAGMGNNSFSDRNMDRMDEDSTEQEIDASSIPIELHMWNIDTRLGNRKEAPVDTLFHHFQNSNLSDGYNGEYNFLGNMGAPRESRIFFNRMPSTQMFFTDPYSAFILPPDKLMFTNTKSPFTNLTYHKSGSNRDGEDRFKSYFSVNVNKKLGIGFSFDYLYGRGRYASQSTAFFNGSLFGSYNSDHYNLHLIMSFNKLKMAENGGIVDDRYITDPLGMAGGRREYQPSDILTNLSETWNHNKGFDILLTHRYNLGFEQETENEKAAKGKEFIPVTSFIHTFQITKNERKFISRDDPEDLYVNNYFHRNSTEDATQSLSVKNTIGISIREGFSPWAKAGLTGFITHEFRKFGLADTLDRGTIIPQKFYKENTLSAGGEFAKREGKLLHYNVTGEIAFLGEDAGQFEVDGKMDLNFRLFKDTIRLDAHAYVKSLNPGFYYRHYHSNYYWWDNDHLSKEYRMRAEGKLSVKRWRTQLMAGFENVKNYTYFANADESFQTSGNATRYRNNLHVKQASNNIQVFSATLKQDFKLGILHLDNEITYQKSSDNTALPLPELNLYHNLYISAKLAKKVLSVELGADMRYFTKYHAPGYSPVIGQFCTQNQQELIEIGGYPLINVYLNLHLKRTRIYVMMYHVNQGMGNSNYFLAPHYPLNPRMFKFGISWNFFD